MRETELEMSMWNDVNWENTYSIHMNVTSWNLYRRFKYKSVEAKQMVSRFFETRLWIIIKSQGVPSIEPTLSQTWGWCLFISSHLIFLSALPSLWHYSRLRQKNVSLSLELSLTEKEYLPEGMQLTNRGPRGTWDLLPQSLGSSLKRKETLTPQTASVYSQSSDTRNIDKATCGRFVHSLYYPLETNYK